MKKTCTGNTFSHSHAASEHIEKIQPHQLKRLYGDSAFHTEDSYNPVRGEVALWQAVITQALMDAASASKKKEAQKHKLHARNWLLGDSDDFVIVCQNAGLDPDYVRFMARAAMARNCKWRAEAVVKVLSTKSCTPPVSVPSIPPHIYAPSLPILPRQCTHRGEASGHYAVTW